MWLIQRLSTDQIFKYARYVIKKKNPSSLQGRRLTPRYHPDCRLICDIQRPLSFAITGEPANSSTKGWRSLLTSVLMIKDGRGVQPGYHSCRAPWAPCRDHPS